MQSGAVMNLVNLARSRRLLREAEKTHADATALIDELNGMIDAEKGERLSFVFKPLNNN